MVQRLHGRHAAQQERAARQLHELSLQGSDAQQAIGGAAGAVPRLVQLTATPGDSSAARKVRHAGMRALRSVISNQPELADAFVGAGGLHPIISCLASRTANYTELWGAAELAVAAMRCAGTAPDGARHALVGSGGLPVLARLLGGNGDQRSAATPVVIALFGAASLNMHVLDAAAEAAPAFAALLGSKHRGVQSAVALALSSIAGGGLSAKAAFFETDALPSMVQLLISGSDWPLCGAALIAIANLACGHVEEHLAAMVESGAIPALVSCLEPPSSAEPALPADARYQAAQALCFLCVNSPPRARAAEAAGATQALARMQREPDTPADMRCWVDMAAAAVAQAGAAQSPAAQPPADVEPASQPLPPARRCCAAGCGATRSLRRCAGCLAVLYCGEACNRAHWRVHRSECRRVQAARSPAAAGGEGAAAQQP